MIPNDFGIIRQPDHNLMALLFRPLTDITEYEVELIIPEYIKNYYAESNGNTPVSNNMRQYAIVDLSKYDYALIPAESSGTSSYASGTRTTRDSGAFSGHSVLIYPTISSESACAWGLFTNFTVLPYAVINVRKDNNYPLICFKRHRSDGANPKGIINPLPEPDPDLEKEAPEPDPDLKEKEIPEQEEDLEEKE